MLLTVDISEIRDRRDSLIAEHGPWIAYNIRLGDGFYTMDNNHVGTAEFMIHGITQAVADLSSKPLDQLRVLDLACHEGGYSIEFGLQGATVVGVEGRPANVEKARFAAEVLGLERVTFELGDVRELSEERLGRFDVVLCLGILYHLEARDAVKLIERSYALCDDLTIVRSAIGLSADASYSVDGHLYNGRKYQEDVAQRAASLDNPFSILPTRASLLNLLADVGFTSVVDLLNPVVPGLDDLRDSVTFAAMRGKRAPYRSIPELDPILPDMRRLERRGPSWIWATAHPQQGIYWRLRERVFHTALRTAFHSQRPIESWRRQRP